MRVAECLQRKAEGGELSDAELHFLISGITSGTVTDDQAGAFLMAVFIRGMTVRETVALTREMLHSGSVLDWSAQPYASRIVDKHSTGGVGDKVSLPLAPALAACGAHVPMISGRGLGHTGGTLDKLEAIPGFNVSLSEQKMKEIVGTVGCVICGQTAQVCPADKRMYAIRDVTGTVSSIPLITGSIVCKKAAEGLKGLVLDTKVGRGAFLKTIEESKALAESMVRASNGLGINTVAVITDMDTPIGKMIGNSLEIAESIACMQGKGPADLEELVCVEGGLALSMVGLAPTQAAGVEMIRKSLHDGSALRKFREMVVAQGGDPRAVDSPAEYLPRAAHQTQIVSAKGGFVDSIEPMGIALGSLHLGAGRNTKDDVLDLAVGVELLLKPGDKIAAGQAWAVIHHNKPVPDNVRDMIEKTLAVSDTQPVIKSRIVQTITE